MQPKGRIRAMRSFTALEKPAMSTAMMERLREVVAEMTANGKYHKERLDARLFASLVYKGDMRISYDKTRQPWRIQGLIGLWETRDLCVFEVGTFYVRQEYRDQRIGHKLFEELLTIAPPDAELFTIMSVANAMGIATGNGFIPISRVTMPDAESWALRAGVSRRLPATACSRMTFRPADGERWMFVRKRAPAS